MFCGSASPCDRRRRRADRAPLKVPSCCRAGRATCSTWWSISPPTCSCRPMRSPRRPAAGAGAPGGIAHRRHRRALFRRPRHEDRPTTTSAASRRCGTWRRSICSCCGPTPWIAVAVIVALAMLTFVPFKFVHPMRVKRLRALNIAALADAGRLLALLCARRRDLEPGPLGRRRAVAIAALLSCCRIGRLVQTLEPHSHDRTADRSPNAWAALVTLTVLEIVLGIDNVIFISVLVAPARRRRPSARARSAWRSRSSSASSCSALTWLMGLTAPVLTVFGFRHVLARHHPDRRRPVPDRQGHARDPCRGRGARRGRTTGAGRARRSSGWSCSSSSSTWCSRSIRSSPRSAWRRTSRSWSPPS